MPAPRVPGRPGVPELRGPSGCAAAAALGASERDSVAGNTSDTGDRGSLHHRLRLRGDRLHRHRRRSVALFLAEERPQHHERGHHDGRAGKTDP